MVTDKNGKTKKKKKKKANSKRDCIDWLRLFFYWLVFSLCSTLLWLLLVISFRSHFSADICVLSKLGPNYLQLYYIDSIFFVLFCLFVSEFQRKMSIRGSQHTHKKRSCFGLPSNGSHRCYSTCEYALIAFCFCLHCNCWWFSNFLYSIYWNFRYSVYIDNGSATKQHFSMVFWFARLP